MDHHEPRVDCSPKANVIVPSSFYVANIKDVAEDNKYLKLNFWPILEVMYTHQDVGSYWSSCHVSSMQAGVCEVNPLSRHMAPRRPCTPPADPRLQEFGGEGTCGLEVHTRHCPLSSNSLHN